MRTAWVASASKKPKFITASGNNIVLSSYFTEQEWKSSSRKVIEIEAGVTIGSTSSSASALRTGTTVNGQPMGGTISLINNGSIWGAGGGAGAGTGGTALEAEVPMNVTNDGTIYGGGGGGGNGGQGAGGYYWPEDKSWKFFFGAWGTGSTLLYWVIYSGFYAFNYDTPPAQQADKVAATNPYPHGGYYYYRGAYQVSYFAAAYYQIRRRTINAIAGGAGGTGGIGQGSNNPVQDGGGSGIASSTSTGGYGGAGAPFGATGNSGSTGGAVNTSYTDQTTGASGGTVGGLGGYYIAGNSNVTWDTIGTVAGRVS